MACCPFGSKTLSELLLVKCWLDPWKRMSMKFGDKFNSLHSRKHIWKCCLQNGNHFVPASMCLDSASQECVDLLQPTSYLLRPGLALGCWDFKSHLCEIWKFCHNWPKKQHKMGLGMSNVPTSLVPTYPCTHIPCTVCTHFQVLFY